MFFVIFLPQRLPFPRYAHVKSGLDTGSSMSKCMEKMKDVHRPKGDEYFKRIKGSQLLELIEDEDVEVLHLASLKYC